MSEEQLREHEARMRRDFGLRANPEWVEWVAKHGVDRGMTLGRPMTDSEFAEMQARRLRIDAAFEAFRAAALESAADAWIDQPAGGLVHLQLAHPSESETAIAERITAEHYATIDLVEHSTHELDQVVTLVQEACRADLGFGQAMNSLSVDISANVVNMAVRPDLEVSIPESLHPAVAAGALVVAYADRRLRLPGSA